MHYYVAIGSGIMLIMQINLTNLKFQDILCISNIQIYKRFSRNDDSCVERLSYFSFFKANVPRINVMTLRNGDDTIILEVTGSPPVIKRSLMIILGLSLGGCESR